MIRISILIGAICSLVIECSRVFDRYSHDGIYMSKYCRETKNCPEGSHIMCMFYVPGQKWGPQCGDQVYGNMTITPEIANVMLKKINEVRSIVALGKEVGKDNNSLPRAYGMNKLKWDPELATLAQVLADQCILAHDLCRATSKFPDPGQTALRVRFSYPDWVPTNSNVGKSKGPTQEKMDYAVHSSVASWHKWKNLVNSDTILQSSSFEELGRGFYYLQLINAPATHVGCGIASYSEYQFFKDTNLTHNLINIFCNFSHKPNKGTPVYNTTRSKRSSTRCGCPLGTYEDDYCLCNSVEGQSCELEDRKDPALILLPIFTYEDAPSSELEEIIRNVNLSMIRKQEIGRSRNSNTFKNLQLELYQKLLPEDSWPFQKRPTKIYQSIQEHFNEPETYLKNSLLNRGYLSLKGSIFSSPQFKLPNRSIKKDTKKEKRNEHFVLNFDRKLLSDHEFNVPKPLIDLNRKFIGTESTYNTNDIARQKLMSLIEDLEYETSHVHFHENIKKKLIAKLERIYEIFHTAQNRNGDRQFNTHDMENVFDSKHIKNEKLISPEDTKRLLQLNLMKGHATLNIDDHREKDIESIKRDKELLRSLMQRNFYLKGDVYEDPLNFEKRKFYQERLDSIQRKLAVLEYYERDHQPSGE